jgi:hypothetical protein
VDGEEDEVHHSECCCITLYSPVAYVNQLKALITVEDYLYQHG